MKYGLLLYPHSNQRYFESLKKLAVAELSFLLPDKKELNPVYENMDGLLLLTFELNNPSKQDLVKVLWHSAMYGLFEIKKGALKPIMDGYEPYFSDDLSAILKYKGKTNEMFTEMMINAAIAAGDFSNSYHQPLHILDPMCGKGTTLFKALKKGYHSAGIEITKKYFPEIEGYLKRYFQFNKMKYTLNRSGYKLPDKKNAQKFTVEVADTNEHFKTGNVRTLQYVAGDTVYAAEYFGKKKFHAIIADLPYGIQHQSKNKEGYSGVLQVIDQSLDSWILTLKTGGTIALSYNAMTLDKSILEEIFAKHNMDVINQGPFSDFSHWVEQAITRDLIIARKGRMQNIEAM